MLIESNPIGTTTQKKQPDGPTLVITEAKHADLKIARDGSIHLPPIAAPLST